MSAPASPVTAMGDALARYAIKAGYLEGAIRGVLRLDDPQLTRQILEQALLRADEYAAGREAVR